VEWCLMLLGGAGILKFQKKSEKVLKCPMLLAA
jgi:hypothetical protein